MVFCYGLRTAPIAKFADAAVVIQQELRWPIVPLQALGITQESLPALAVTPMRMRVMAQSRPR